jgi:hypothetical protein
LRIFSVSDIHGSVKRFRKRVSAGNFPGADLLRAVDILHIAGRLVQHESSWSGDGWLRQRPGGGGAPPPPPLALTPPLAAGGARFR